MISLYTIITVVFCHWIADFFLQSSYMAQEKSKCNWALLEHVWVYIGGLLMIGALNCMYWPSVGLGMIWVIVNAIAHFFTDWVTSRASSCLYKDNRIHDFFVVIGGDQMIHYITLFGTFVYFTSL